MEIKIFPMPKGGMAWEAKQDDLKILEMPWSW